MHQDILINNVTLLPLDDGQTDLIKNGFLAIKNGKIDALGPMAELPANTISKKTIDGTGCILMPGLVNTHTHAPMTLFRGLADDLPLMTWLNEHIFPAEAENVNPEMVYWCSKLAAVEMILAGTTTAADGYFLEDQVARAFADCGLRSVVAQGVIDFPAPGVPDPAKNIETAARFIDNWQDRNDLITPAVFCHSPYTCSPDTLRKAKEMAREKGAKLFIHVAETRAEIDQLKEQQGTSPVRYLDSLGILDQDTVCVHCIWLDDEDVEILAKSGAGVSTCPQSNMKLGSGIAPLKELLQKEIIVGLGTDGCASNNTLDIFQEMDLCAKLHKVRDLDPTALPAGQILQMATWRGAELLGLQEKIGSLEPGKTADIILLDLQQPHMQPFYSQDLLVYAANGADVSTVIINGRLVLENRRILTCDMQEVMERVRNLARSL
jgi:5-methylthioadenosine/S-adenosylhomocysteine deaminase